MVYVNVFIDGSPATSQYCAAGHNEIKGFRDTSGKYVNAALRCAALRSAGLRCVGAALR